MLVIVNALKSISRSKGRNILIGIIVLTIAVSCCIALSIKRAAKEAETAGLDQTQITASISVDRQKMMENLQSGSASGGLPDMSSMRQTMTQYQDLSLDELQSYAQSELLANFYYTNTVSLSASGDLEAYSTESETDTSSSASSDSTGNIRGMPDGMPEGGFGGRGEGPMSFGGRAMGDFSLTGYSAEDAMSKFISGTAKITDGEMFDVTADDYACLISAELAAFNGLSVGDTVTLANPNDQEETYAFTVSGIYTDTSSSDSGDQMRFSTAQDPANLICTSAAAAQAILDNSSAVATTSTDDNGNETSTKLAGQVAGTYVFSSKEDYEAFSAELTEKGLSEYYTLSSADLNNYDASLVPLQNLSKFATTLLLIILGIGGVILIVINVFNIRERKYEVGVLTAIGVKKGKVAMQFVTELLCITLIAIVIGAGIGAAASVPVSNSLLASQVEQQQSQSQTQNENFGRPGEGNTNFKGGFQGGAMMAMASPDAASADVTYMDKINATTDFTILLQLIGIGVGLTVLSSLAAVVFVLRYEPLKILSNRA